MTGLRKVTSLPRLAYTSPPLPGCAAPRGKIPAYYLQPVFFHTFISQLGLNLYKTSHLRPSPSFLLSSSLHPFTNPFPQALESC